MRTTAKGADIAGVTLWVPGFDGADPPHPLAHGRTSPNFREFLTRCASAATLAAE